MKIPRVSDFDPNAKEIPTLKSSLDHIPVIQKPKVSDGEAKIKPVLYGVPHTVPRPVPPSDPLIPKVKRPIRQRQPFNIFEEQYKRLKQIAESEKAFINDRGMSQSTRNHR